MSLKGGRNRAEDEGTPERNAMDTCPSCGLDLGGRNPAYCPGCTTPLLGQVGARRPLQTQESARRTDRRSRAASGRLRLTGRVVGVAVAVVVGLAGPIRGWLGAPDRDQSGAVVGAGRVQVEDLRVGDCLDWPEEGADAVEVDDVDLIPCGEPHQLEMYATVDLSSIESYPGDEALFSEAGLQCYESFATFVGVPFEDSQLDFAVVYPSEESWNDGQDRDATCLVYRLDEAPVTGTLRDSRL